MAVILDSLLDYCGRQALKIFLENDVYGQQFRESGVRRSVKKIVKYRFNRIESLTLGMLVDEEIQRPLTDASGITVRHIESTHYQPRYAGILEGIRN